MPHKVALATLNMSARGGIPRLEDGVLWMATSASWFDTELGEMHLDLWKKTIELTDVRLMNPDGYEGGEAVWIRRLAQWRQM